MITLQKLSTGDGKAFYDMLQGIGSVENGFHNSVRDMPFAEFAAWLQKNAEMSEGINLEDWMVPQTTFWLMDCETPVGIGRIRHFLNDSLRRDGGHIGYAVAAPHRGKGFGNAILALLLAECGNLGIEEAHIGANKDNIRSNRIIQKHGGQLLRETEDKNHYTIRLGC